MLDNIEEAVHQWERESEDVEQRLKDEYEENYKD